MTDRLPTFDGFGLGALPDPPDPRDHLYSAYLTRKQGALVLSPPPSGKVAADAEVEILNQDELGSCTANEAAAHYAILQVIEGWPVRIPSRLQIYYAARKALGLSVRRDTGATGRACAKVLATDGACPESLWKYDIANYRKQPPDRCMSVSPDHQLIEYLSIPAGTPQTLDLIKTSLAAGFPVGFSFNVYANFHPDKDGVIPMPAGRLEGGHRMMLVGYDDATGLVDARNSWGLPWGIGGRCKFWYDHVLQQFGDLWTFRRVEG